MKVFRGLKLWALGFPPELDEWVAIVFRLQIMQTAPRNFLKSMART
jgi:hypothetical protein